MRLFVLAALVLFVFSLVVAAGASFVTTWQVWVSAGLVSLLVDRVLADRE